MTRGTAVLVGMGWLVAPAAAQGGGGGGARGAGRITMLEKGGKPSPDLGSAVVFLEGAGAPARPGSFEIAINDKEFVPRVLVVPQGSTVRFPNHDPFEHNVFSVSDPNPFDLGLYGRGEAKGSTFTGPGLVRVFCNVHPRMVAFVHVMATRYVTQPASDGSFAIEGVPPGSYRVHVWHERGPQVVQDVIGRGAGTSDLTIQLDARGFHWVPHKNKHGKDYPTNAGRERY